MATKKPGCSSVQPGSTSAPGRGRLYFWGFTFDLLRFSFTFESAGMVGSAGVGVTVVAGSVVVVVDSVVVVEVGAGAGAVAG